jgi:hypothetical protein
MAGFEVSTYGRFWVSTEAMAMAQRIWDDWARWSEGCYVLRSNIPDWTLAELWRTYIQLAEAEAAFRIQKSELALRPIWHQRADRVEAHILVCFLAYVLPAHQTAHGGPIKCVPAPCRRRPRLERRRPVDLP